MGRPGAVEKLRLEEQGRSMAGHSQFKNIMHKKGKQDALR
jgi:hypothetical protein